MYSPGTSKKDVTDYNLLIKIVVFFVVTPCSTVGGGHHVSEEHAASIFRVELCRFTNKRFINASYKEGNYETEGKGVQELITHSFLNS
jgi:hypothetical protein